MQGVEASLIARNSELVQSTSFFFSLVVLAVVLAGFGYFLKTQYELNKELPKEKRIPFVPMVWYSATRNVRSEEYAGQLQPFEIETGYGVSGPPDGSSTTEIRGVDYGTPDP
jgi:hypothetical protein